MIKRKKVMKYDPKKKMFEIRIFKIFLVLRFKFLKFL